MRRAVPLGFTVGVGSAAGQGAAQSVANLSRGWHRGKQWGSLVRAYRSMTSLGIGLGTDLSQWTTLMLWKPPPPSRVFSNFEFRVRKSLESCQLRLASPPQVFYVLQDWWLSHW